VTSGIVELSAYPTRPDAADLVKRVASSVTCRQCRCGLGKKAMTPKGHRMGVGANMPLESASLFPLGDRKLFCTTIGSKADVTGDRSDRHDDPSAALICCAAQRAAQCAKLRSSTKGGLGEAGSHNEP
jgi:hypothetical protein